MFCWVGLDCCLVWLREVCKRRACLPILAMNPGPVGIALALEHQKCSGSSRDPGGEFSKVLPNCCSGAAEEGAAAGGRGRLRPAAQLAGEVRASATARCRAVRL